MGAHPSGESPPEKILIIHSGGIGDLLLALPAMRLFRSAFSRSPLEMLGLPERLSLVAHDLKAKVLHSIDQAGMAHFYLDEPEPPPRLTSFFSSFGAVLCFGKAGGQTLAGNLERVGAGRVLFVPSFPPEGMGIHAADHLLESLRKAGVGGAPPGGPLSLPEEALAFGRAFFSQRGVQEGERILAIHPGSGSHGKNWDPESFARVADAFAEKARILLVWGPAEDGAQAVRRAMKKSAPIIADNLPLLRLAALLKKSNAYLGNDSGITHLAASLGLPTAALFGPTDPAVWGPQGPAVRILQGEDSPHSPTPTQGRPPGRISVDPAEAIGALSPFL